VECLLYNNSLNLNSVFNSKVCIVQSLYGVGLEFKINAIVNVNGATQYKG